MRVRLQVGDRVYYSRWEWTVVEHLPGDRVRLSRVDEPVIEEVDAHRVARAPSCN